MTDTEIIELYWQRDEEAIVQTDMRYGPCCFSLAQRIRDCREDSHECVNDTWYRTWRSIPPQRPSYFRAFLAKITRRLALDRLRRSRAQRRGGGELALALEELGECAGSAPSPEDAAISSELSELINCFLGSLNERERGIFLRRYFYVETPEQIAERYGLKRGNVSTILSRTRSKLKSFLESEGYNT